MWLKAAEAIAFPNDAKIIIAIEFHDNKLLVFETGIRATTEHIIPASDSVTIRKRLRDTFLKIRQSV